MPITQEFCSLTRALNGYATGTTIGAPDLVGFEAGDLVYRVVIGASDGR